MICGGFCLLGDKQVEKNVQVMQFWFPSGGVLPNYVDTGIVFVVDVFSDEVRPKKVNEVSLFFVFFLEVGQIWGGPHR